VNVLLQVNDIETPAIARALISCQVEPKRGGQVSGMRGGSRFHSQLIWGRYVRRTDLARVGRGATGIGRSSLREGPGGGKGGDAVLPKSFRICTEKEEKIGGWSRSWEGGVHDQCRFVGFSMQHPRGRTVGHRGRNIQKRRRCHGVAQRTGAVIGCTWAGKKWDFIHW